MTEVLETVLCERLGVDRKLLLALRKKNAPAGEWKNTAAGIAWTSEGARWVEANLAENGSGDAGKGANNHEQEAGPPDAVSDVPGVVLTNTGVTEQEPPSWRPVMAELRVKKVYTKNSKLLLALDAQGQPQRVRVRTNQFFVPGMVIPCIHQQGDLWTLNGKCPKRRGKFIQKKGAR